MNKRTDLSIRPHLCTAVTLWIDPVLDEKYLDKSDTQLLVTFLLFKSVYYLDTSMTYNLFTLKYKIVYIISIIIWWMSFILQSSTIHTFKEIVYLIQQCFYRHCFASLEKINTKCIPPKVVAL